MATRQELRDRAANDLGILPFGQSLNPPDTARVESAYQEVYQELKERGLAVWAYDGEIPAQYVPYLSALTANNCVESGSYGVSEERYARITNAAARAVSSIRALVNGPYLPRDCPRDF